MTTAKSKRRARMPSPPVSSAKQARGDEPLNRSDGAALDALVVKPRKACRLLDCGNTRLYELLAAGELQSFKDGKSRKITTESIRSYIERLLAEGEGS